MVHNHKLGVKNRRNSYPVQPWYKWFLISQIRNPNSCTIHDHTHHVQLPRWWYAGVELVLVWASSCPATGRPTNVRTPRASFFPLICQLVVVLVATNALKLVVTIIDVNMNDPFAVGDAHITSVFQAPADYVHGGWARMLANRIAREECHLGQTMVIDKADVVQATRKDAWAKKATVLVRI